ncbi:MAG: glycosyltransferase, partial [Flavobacteriales bacterium]|nr:glycosyltransferase [Flavobacteriales bacterium]
MKISVITPVYNAEKYITQAVESALQFDEVYEVILVED